MTKKFLLPLLPFVPLYVVVASQWVSPREVAVAGLLGLLFPAALAVAGVGLLLTLVFAPKRVWLPLLGFVPAACAIRAYVPVNFPSPHPRGALKVMTYNTMNFGGYAADSLSGGYSLSKDVLAERPDIFCLQEAAPPSAASLPEIEAYFRQNGGYHYRSHKIGASHLAVGSKFRILSSETVCRNGQNGAAAFRLRLPEGDTLLVVNCHLESMHLSHDERSDYHTMVKNPDSLRLDSSMVAMARKLGRATRERAAQIDTIVSYLDAHPCKRVVVCGDLNDTPVSYAHRRLASRLTDAYAASGNGPGRSFARDAIYVRIDHLFCSSAYRPYGARIDRSLTRSDHYPLIVYLKELP